jgi:two-component system LytT family response regulator
MSNYKALIIDDERLARVALKKELSAFPEFEIVGEASSIATAVKEIRELDPDVLFLDIQLSDGSGFDLLEQVEFGGKIIFVTAYNEYATRAFEINAQDYLIKPVSKERLSRVLQKLSSKFIENDHDEIVPFNYEDRIMVEQKESINFLKLDKLVCIRAERDYTLLLDCNGKEYLILERIGKWQKKLPDEHFVRVHRNAIINFNFIEKAEKTGNTALVFLKGISKPVRVSRGYYKMLRAKYFYK